MASALALFNLYSFPDITKRPKEHRLPTTQSIKEINAMSIRLAKKAPSPITMATIIDEVINVIERATSAVTSVPIMPTSKHKTFFLRHFFRASDSQHAATSIAVIKTIRVKTDNPNAIHTDVTILGINPNANNRPTAIPITTLIITPTKQQHPKPSFRLPFILIPPFFNNT